LRHFPADGRDPLLDGIQVLVDFLHPFCDTPVETDIFVMNTGNIEAVSVLEYAKKKLSL